MGRLGVLLSLVGFGAFEVGTVRAEGAPADSLARITLATAGSTEVKSVRVSRANRVYTLDRAPSGTVMMEHDPAAATTATPENVATVATALLMS